MATLTEILVAVREISFDRYPIPVFVLKKSASKVVTNDAYQFAVKNTAGSPLPTCAHVITTPASTGVNEVHQITIGATVTTGDTFTVQGKTYTAVLNDTPTLVATGLDALLNGDGAITALFSVTFSAGVITMTVLVAGDSIEVTSSCTSLTAFIHNYNPFDTEKVSTLLSSLRSTFPYAYTGYFSEKDKVSSLLLNTNSSLALNLSIFRRFFLSDDGIIDIILDYCVKVIKTTESIATLPTNILLFNDESVRHLILWCSIQLVEMRRIAEQAAMVFQMNFSDGSGGVAGSNLSYPGSSVTVNVGSVFSLNDDNSYTSQYFNADYNRVGSDNVLGDKESFWFKLFLHLRKKLEGEFKDFYFRDDNVIVGKIILEKELNWLTYYDSYPFTLSALTRSTFLNQTY